MWAIIYLRKYLKMKRVASQALAKMKQIENGFSYVKNPAHKNFGSTWSPSKNAAYLQNDQQKESA